MSELPEGWTTASLAEICLRLVDGSHNPPPAVESGRPMLSARNVNDFRVLFDDYRLISEHDFELENARTQVSPGDVLLTIVGTIGRTAVVSNNHPPFALQRSVAVLKPRGVDSRYLAYVLNSPQQQQWLRDNAKGTAQKGVYLKTLGAAQVPIAPSTEQTRIVAKLEELLSDLDAGVAELKAAQKKLAKYRQSLLKAAVEGTLTADWRAARAPLPPRGGGAGGEGANTDAAAPDEAWLKQRSKDLRREQTPFEHTLWQQLRAKRFAGYKFRRQQVLGRFVVDFVCFAKRLIVELDGGQHAEAVDHDNRRDAWLEQQGFRVLRFWNNEWSQRPEAVLESIWQALQQEPPLPNPSPARGEGLLEPESGAQLLERILAERRARWEARQLTKFAEQAKNPPKDWQEKYPEPVQPDTTNLPELPEGWVWASVEQVSSDEPYSLAIGPFGSNLKVPDYRESGIPLVFVRNIRSGNYGGTRTKYVTAEKAEELSAHSVHAGDVLITKMGEPPGDVDVYPEHQPPAIITADCIKVRCWVGLMRPAFLKAVINSHIGRQQIEPMTQGVAQKKVSLGRFRSLAVPVAPIHEQDKLIGLLSAANDAAIAQEAAIESSLKQSTAQRQNILRAAFAGQLVPQDPIEEPAGVLLARIRAERAAQAAAKKPRERSLRDKA